MKTKNRKRNPITVPADLKDPWVLLGLAAVCGPLLVCGLGALYLILGVVLLEWTDVLLVANPR